MSVKCPDWFPQALWDQQTEATQSGILKVGKDHELVKEMLSKYEAERDGSGDTDDTTSVDEDDPTGELSGDDNKEPPTSEDKAVSVEIAHAVTLAAIEAAKSLSDATLADMKSSAIKKQEAAAASARIAYSWLYVGQGKRNDNMIGNVLSWPKPGTSSTKDKPMSNPDRFSYKRGDVNINTSFYGEELDKTVNGQELADEIAAIKSAMPGENRSPKAPKYWVDKCDAARGDGKTLLEKAIKAVGSRRTYQIGMLREAAGAVQVMEAIRTKMPHLGASVATEGYSTDGGKTTLLRVDTTLAAPFKLYGKVKEEDGTMTATGTTYYTCKQFARLDVDKAIANGNTLTALIATVAKKPKGAGKNQSKGNKVAAISVGDIKTFESMTAEVLAFMNDNANLMMLINTVGSDKTDAHFIATLVNLSNAFDALTSKISKTTLDNADKIIAAEKKAAELVNKAKAA